MTLSAVIPCCKRLQVAIRAGRHAGMQPSFKLKETARVRVLGKGGKPVGDFVTNDRPRIHTKQTSHLWPSAEIPVFQLFHVMQMGLTVRATLSKHKWEGGGRIESNGNSTTQQDSNGHAQQTSDGANRFCRDRTNTMHNRTANSTSRS